MLLLMRLDRRSEGGEKNKGKSIRCLFCCPSSFATAAVAAVSVKFPLESTKERDAEKGRIPLTKGQQHRGLGGTRADTKSELTTAWAGPQGPLRRRWGPLTIENEMQCKTKSENRKNRRAQPAPAGSICCCVLLGYPPEAAAATATAVVPARKESEIVLTATKGKTKRKRSKKL